MKLTKNIVALQKGLIVAPNKGQENKSAAATVQAHLMQLGYMLDQEAFDMLCKSNQKFIVDFNNEATDYLRSVLGGKRNFTPLYKNFPEEVMSLSDCELYMNAIIHYWSGGIWEPSQETFEKPMKFEKIKYNLIKLASQEKFENIFTSLVSINTSLSPQDMKVVEWFAKSGEKLVFPEVIPFKENLCTLAALGIENLPVKTTTDVLRIAVHMSGGDISLPKVPVKEVRAHRWTTMRIENPERQKFKFKKFTRQERKYLLSLLEQTNCDASEMVLKDQRWIRLGEILHPMEYASKFPKSAEAFNKIRNGQVKSWYSVLDSAMSKGLEEGLKVLVKKPGEFSRRLDWLIRKNPRSVDLIMSYFNKSVSKTSNKVMFELLNHFEKRKDSSATRSIMVKGARKRTQLSTLDPLDSKTVETIQQKIFETLANKFSSLESLGKCWVDEELKKIPLPTNMRSMNFSTKPVLRGQRIPFENQSAKVVRAFVHWFDELGQEDLDLSATFVPEETEQNKSQIEVLAFTGLKVGKSVHSGDIRHRKGACAEYVDIDIKDALKRGFRYVSIDVRNYNGRSLSSVESVFGIMEREHPKANKTWLPETIVGCQNLESTSSNTLIAILDIKTMEYIMLDIDSEGMVVARMDVNTTLKVIEEYSKLPKFSVYDLIMLHIKSRGNQVKTQSEADTCFKMEDFMLSYEKTGELMGV